MRCCDKIRSQLCQLRHACYTPLDLRLRACADGLGVLPFKFIPHYQSDFVNDRSRKIFSFDIVRLMEAAEYYNSRPKKSTGAGVLFFNSKGEMLIVKPTYLDRWLWVGGGVEKNETPLAAAKRESAEEIGFRPQKLKLAFVQHRPPKSDGQDESIHFVFIADTVGEDFLAKLKLQDDEITEAKFVAVEDLQDYISGQRASAVQEYVVNRSNGDGIYIENGHYAQ